MSEIQHLFKCFQSFVFICPWIAYTFFYPLFPTALLRVVYRNAINYPVASYPLSILYVKVFLLIYCMPLCLWYFFFYWREIYTFYGVRSIIDGFERSCLAPSYKIIFLYFISIVWVLCFWYQDSYSTCLPSVLFPLFVFIYWIAITQSFAGKNDSFLKCFPQVF